MGNAEICEQCESFEISQAPTTASSKSTKRLRPIFSNLLDQSDHKNANPKIVALTQQGIYEVIYPEGEVYRGEMQGELRHGQGRHMWPGGNYYEGAWHLDKAHGPGVLKTSSFRFEGQMVDDSPINGRMETINKRKEEIYEGELKDFMYHGKGILSVKNEFVYQGQFEQNKRKGKGKIKFSNGSEYEGDFQKGAMHGIGRFTSSELQYTGEFSGGRIHGKGRCVWKNGAVFVGSYANGIKEGYGEYFYENGQVYMGMWKKGKPFEQSFTFGKGKREVDY